MMLCNWKTNFLWIMNAQRHHCSWSCVLSWWKQIYKTIAQLQQRICPVNPRSSEQSRLAGIPAPVPAGANLNIRSGCSGLCPVKLWVSPKTEVSLPLGVPMAINAWPHSQTEFSDVTQIPLAASSSSLPFLCSSEESPSLASVISH